MKKFIVPEENIDKMAIEEAVRKDAWLVVPESINVKCIHALAKDMGLDDQLKVECWNKIRYTDLRPYDNMVFLYADEILKNFYYMETESLIDNDGESSMFLIGE